MGEYGYAYKSVSTYSTTSVKNETRKPVIQPFVPSVPKSSTDHGGYSEGHVTRKTIIPVTSSRPYDATEKYPSKGDDDDAEWHRKTSPLGGSPRKVDEFPSPTKLHNETNRPQRFSPVANSPGWRHTPQPTSPAYSSAEGRKPFGSAGKTINDHDGYDGHGSNGYGGHAADYGGHKEGRKPIENTIRNDNYDGHHNGTNGYGSDYSSMNMKGHKPIASTIRNDNYDGYDDRKKQVRKPIEGTIRSDNHNHGGYYNNGYGGDKEGRKPIGSSSTKIDNYQYHAPNGYGGFDGHDDDHYNQNEGYKPISNNPNYNNGYGIGNGNNKEQHRPFGFGSSTPNHHKYDRERPGHMHMHMDKPIGPKICSAWTAAPRKGTQLSEPTNDIEKALELLRMEAAKREHMQNNTDYEYEYDPRPTPRTPLANWAAPPGRKFDKPTGSPQYGSPTRVNNKFGNSRPGMSPTRDTIYDGRDGGGDDYYRDEYGHVPVIDSREAEKKFKGTRVW